MTTNSNPYQFLAGGGEMGELTRTKDWSKTPVGDPATWPQSLRTTLSIILNSKFPMFLFWGPESICFYNDAYRPSLGNDGKHPHILGSRGEDYWKEIWAFIKPLIDTVLAGGEANWNEDQLLPIYRNGAMEDVYWTFSYSPVRDESGNPAGVFVTCTETTEKVNTLKQLEESKNQLKFAIEAAEFGTFDYNPVTNKFSANKRLKSWFGLSSDATIELYHATDAIAEKDRQQVQHAIAKSLEYASGGQYDIEYTIVHPVTKNEKIVRARGKASFDENKIACRLDGTLQDITEQVIALKKIEESERNMRLMILQAPVSIAIFKGPDHVVEIVNEKALELWGRKEKDVMNRPIFEAMPELLPQGVKELLDNIYNDNSFSAKELPVQISRNGILETSIINFVYDPLYDTEGKVNGIMTVGFDVTEQVMARKKVEESEQRVRTLVENAPFPIGVYVGKEMRIQLANQSILDIWGKGNDVIGKLYSDILPELSSQEIFEQLDGVYTTGIPFHNTNQHLNLVVDGKTIPYYFNYSFTPLYDENGAVYAVMNTAANVTDLNVAKLKVEESVAALSKTAKRLQLALEAGNLGSYEIDIATGAIDCTLNCKINFGRNDNDEFTYQSLLESIVPEDRQPMEDAVRNALKNNSIYSAQYRVTWPDGSLHWIHAAGIPFYDTEGKAVQMVGVTAEITEQKLFEQELSKQVQERTRELEQNNLQLEKMNKELQSFAYVSSHDLQEPLRKIQTFADHILDKEQDTLSERGKHSFKRMQEAARRMQTLIEDLLSYSRTNNTADSFVNTDLTVIVKEVSDELKDTLQEKNATLKFDKLCEAHIIPFQFRQLMNNLISNSLKFSDKKRPPVITISSEIVNGAQLNNPKLSDKKNYCHITVSDNGIGFEAEYSEKIFEVFQRLHSKSDYQGTGIGLAIVKKIIENHNGVITATGKLNQGATFDMYIPV